MWFQTQYRCLVLLFFLTQWHNVTYAFVTQTPNFYFQRWIFILMGYRQRDCCVWSKFTWHFWFKNLHWIHKWIHNGQLTKLFATIFSINALIYNQSIHFNCLQWTLWYCSTKNKWKKFLRVLQNEWYQINVVLFVFFIPLSSQQRTTSKVNNIRREQVQYESDHAQNIDLLCYIIQCLVNSIHKRNNVQFAWEASQGSSVNEYLFNTHWSTLDAFLNDFMTLSHRWFHASQRIS